MFLEAVLQDVGLYVCITPVEHFIAIQTINILYQHYIDLHKKAYAMKPAKPQSATMDEQTFVPPTMRALYYTPIPTTVTDCTAVDGTGARSGLVFDTDHPVPMPSPTQYLIKVQTAAFSHDELRLARVLNPTQSIPRIPLHNVCGTVISTPSQDHWNSSGPKFKVDEVVFGLISYTRDGAAADYVLATEDELALKPQNISAAEAATLPLPALTAWQALFTYSGLIPRNIKDGTTKRQTLRVLVTNARDSEAGLQTLQLLRSPSLFPPSHYEQPPWICATCSSAEHENILRSEFYVDETILAPLPLEPTFNLAAPFHDNRWGPVDIVIDCAGGQMFRQAHHSPHIVKDYGVVLTAVDPGPAQQQYQDRNGDKRGIFSRFIGGEPDGEALERIAELVETEHSVRGRVESIVDLVNSADILEGGAAGAGGARQGGMIVVRVN